MEGATDPESFIVVLVGEISLLSTFCVPCLQAKLLLLEALTLDVLELL